MLAEANDFLKAYAALAAAVGAFLALAVRPMIERMLKGRAAWRAIEAERGDLIRHFRANERRLAEMNRILRDERLVPQRNHVQKLAVMESLTLFSDNALEHLPASKVATVQRARVRLRNLNIDVAEAVRQHDDAEWDQLPKMLQYLDQIHLRLAAWAPFMLDALDQRPPNVAVVAQVRRPPK